MPTETRGRARPTEKRVPDRTLSDVAKEAFQNRVMEGDRPNRNRPERDDEDLV